MPEPQPGINLSRRKLRSLIGGRDSRYSWLELLTPDMVVWEDDFMGDTLHGGYQSTAGAGAGALAAALVAGQLGGMVRLVTGTAGDSTARSDLSLGIHFRADMGPVFLCRLQMSAITGVKVEVGFTDVVSGTDAGAVNVKATPTFTAADAALWALDTNDNTDWEGLGVDSGTAAVTQEAAIAPVAATYETLVVALREYNSTDRLAAATYLRFNADGNQTYPGGNGAPVWQSLAVSSDVLLTPWIYAEARNTTSKNVDIDFIKVWQRRVA